MNIVHMVPITEYIVCSFIFLLLTLGKICQIYHFKSTFVSGSPQIGSQWDNWDFRIFEWATSPFKTILNHEVRFNGLNRF